MQRPTMVHPTGGKGAELMGGAINRSFISAHFLLSAYFLTAWTYKNMRLTTQIYGTSFLHVFAEHACLILIPSGPTVRY